MRVDEKEFERLKREAEQRMKELHAEAAVEETVPETAQPVGKVEKPAEKSGITDILFKDKDRTLILALLLTDEKDGKVDYSLLMALLYILL